MTYKHKDLTSSIIQTFYDVYNELVYGFLEKVYQNAMFYELKARNLFVEAQKQVKVFYKNIEIGEYYPDLIINDSVIIELKAAETLCEKHENQLINYLKATNKEVGLLLNFGKKPEISRKIFDNDRKNL